MKPTADYLNLHFFRPGLIPASLSVKVVVQNRHILTLTNVAYGCEMEK